MQSLNQLFFALFSLILASLFLGTFRIPASDNQPLIRKFWLMSVGLRSLAFATWALAPLIGTQFVTLASTSFLASTICLALLFRSWRKSVDRPVIFTVILILVFFAIFFEFLRQQENSFVARMTFISVMSCFISLWELSELRKKIQRDSEFLLKVIFSVTTIQMMMNVATGIMTNIYTSSGLSQVTQNHSQSMFVMWVALSLHLIVYMFIGSYLYQKIAISENKIGIENEMIQTLLSERDSMITSLMLANRAASTGALSASLAHELSQPLAATMINGRVLERKIEKGEIDRDEMSKTISNIIKDNRRASNIVLALKNIFKQEKVILEKMTIVEVLEQLRPILLPQLKEKKIELAVNIQYSPVVNININEFHQVIVNLANNAIDALDAHDTEVKKITLETRNNGDRLEIVITDNGPGIPAGLHESLFELLKTTKEFGMGLGLWLSKHIIEQRHGGKIRFNPKVTQGAEIIIELPVTA